MKNYIDYIEAREFADKKPGFLKRHKKAIIAGALGAAAIGFGVHKMGGLSATKNTLMKAGGKMKAGYNASRAKGGSMLSSIGGAAKAGKSTIQAQVSKVSGKAAPITQSVQSSPTKAATAAVGAGKAPKVRMSKVDKAAQFEFDKQNKLLELQNQKQAIIDHQQSIFGQAKDGNYGQALKNAGSKGLDAVKGIGGALLPTVATAAIPMVMNKVAGGGGEEQEEEPQQQPQQQVQPQQQPQQQVQPQGQPQQQVQQRVQSNVAYVLDSLKCYCNNQEQRFAFNEIIRSFSEYV